MKLQNIALSTLLVAVILLGSTALIGATAAAAIDTGPDDAVAPTGDWQALQAGEQDWYAFQYAGDRSQIQVRLEAVPEEGAAFAVWTPEQIRRWRAGSEVEPIGRGSPDPSTTGVQVWSGNFNDKGTYYLVVDYTGNRPATTYYLLTVSGDGVSLSASPPAATATPQPTKRTPKPAVPSEPTGMLVFQTSMGGDIYTVNVDGSNLQRIADGMDPTWSPDGSRIAFIRWREPRGVWVADIDSTGAATNEWRVFDWSEPRWTSWSPDGEEILFSRVSGGRLEEREFCFRGFCFTFPAYPHWKVGVVRAADGSFYEPPPPDSQVSRAPDWAPVGDQIVFDDVQGLRVQNLDRTVSYQITDDAKDTSPVWSPDGNQVAFVRRQHDHWEIYAVDADGGNVRRLTDTPKKPNGQVGNSASPAWSPDGNYLAFLTDRSGKWEIWIMRANGSNPKPMFKSALNGLALDYAALGELAISWTE